MSCHCKKPSNRACCHSVDFVSLRSLTAPVHNPDRVANLPTVSSSFPNRTSRCTDRMTLCFYLICDIGKGVFVSHLALVLYSCLHFLFV